MVDSVYQAVMNNLPKPLRVKPNGWVNFNCPVCVSQGEPRKDIRHRGSFKPVDNGFVINCWNCKFKTGWSIGYILTPKLKLFLRECGASNNYIREVAFEAWRNKESGIQTAIPEYDFLRIPKFNKLSLDDSYQMLDYNLSHEYAQKAIEYLTSRRDNILELYDFYWSEKEKTRLLIPFYQDEKLVGYTKRSFVPSKNKYLSEQPSDYIFRCDLMKTDIENLLVFEGVFESILLNGVAMLGSSINDVQANWLKSCGKDIIIVPDKDKAGYELLENALKYNFKVSIPKWPRNVNDPSECAERYGRLYTIRLIIDNIISDKTKALTFGKSILINGV